MVIDFRVYLLTLHQKANLKKLPSDDNAYQDSFGTSGIADHDTLVGYAT